MMIKLLRNSNMLKIDINHRSVRIIGQTPIILFVKQLIKYEEEKEALKQLQSTSIHLVLFDQHFIHHPKH